MSTVLYAGTAIASVAYMICGIFGYATFSMNPARKFEMEKQNILLADYGDNFMIKLCQILLLIVILFASPFCVLPAKDSFEELMMKGGEKFSQMKNFICTVAIVVVTWALSLVLKSLGEVMTILGATTNTGIGFLIPIVFYLKIIGAKDKTLTWEKILAYVTFVVVCLCSVAEMYTFIYTKMNGSE